MYKVMVGRGSVSHVQGDERGEGRQPCSNRWKGGMDEGRQPYSS